MSPQTLPTEWHAREALREKGQFWTPAWVAEAMVGYVVSGGAETVFDPAVGPGAFLHAVKRMAAELDRTLHLSGTETDPAALRQASETGLNEQDLANVLLQDFTLYKPTTLLPAIVANPPYIRHHRLSLETKVRLRNLSENILGFPLDGRTGYHIYFLIHALRLLADSGRLAFILPADTFEGAFAPKLWQWITSRYRLDAVVTFAPAASPFPGVDTNAVVVFIQKSPPQPAFWWTRVQEPGTGDLKRWMLGGFAEDAVGTLPVCRRALDEALRTGLSCPVEEEAASGFTLGDYAKVLRGIATGANEFFFLTHEQAKSSSLPFHHLLPAVGRTRDVETEVLTSETLRRLDAKGRPTLLLSLGSQPPEEKLEASVRAYLHQGREMQLPERVLIKTRRPWYKMEVREVPPLLFAYLGRRNARFVLNEAGVVPLTGFLCIYPHQPEFTAKLWRILQHPETVRNLSKVGKSHGGGAIKVEPRALERLPLPEHLVLSADLPATKLFA